MSNQIHVGDIGTQLVVTVLDDGDIVDISTASSIKIILKKPNGSSDEKTAVLYTDGTDGAMVYTSDSGDFTISGRYKIQGRVEIDGGVYYTSIATFKVNCNL